MQAVIKPTPTRRLLALTLASLPRVQYITFRSVSSSSSSNRSCNVHAREGGPGSDHSRIDQSSIGQTRAAITLSLSPAALGLKPPPPPLNSVVVSLVAWNGGQQRQAPGLLFIVVIIQSDHNPRISMHCYVPTNNYCAVSSVRLATHKQCYYSRLASVWPRIKHIIIVNRRIVFGPFIHAVHRNQCT